MTKVIQYLLYRWIYLKINYTFLYGTMQENKKIVFLHIHAEVQNKSTFAKLSQVFILTCRRKKYPLLYTLHRGWHDYWSSHYKWVPTRAIASNVYLSRHMSLIFWALCLIMLPPSLVWRMPGRLPHAISSDPFPPAQAWPRYTSYFKYEQAGTQACCTPVLLVWDSGCTSRSSWILKGNVI